MRTLYPLTSSQQEIWFDQILHADLPIYNIGGYVKIPGPVKPELFEKAINLLIRKHDALRIVLTADTDEDGVPLQAFLESLTITVPMHDLSTASDPHKSASAWMQERFTQPFKLIEHPLFRYDLIKLAEDNYYWLLQYHHLIIDGWGTALLNRSLANIYTQLVNNNSPDLSSPSYTSFIENDRTYIASKTFEKNSHYWASKFTNIPDPLITPRQSSPTSKALESDREAIFLSQNFYQQLNILAKKNRASLFHLLLGAFYVYFARTSQRNDISIGLSLLNRSGAQFKQTVGLFTGTSPALFDFGLDLTFAELLQQISKSLRANYRHQRLSISEINRAIELKPPRTQIFDISLAYLNHDHDAVFHKTKGSVVQLFTGYEQDPLMISVEELHAQHDVKIDFVYNKAYFNPDDIKQLQSRFLTILEAVLKQEDAPLSQWPIMTAQEQRQLQAWNETTTDYPRDKTIVDLFEAQVIRTPDNIAVIFEGEQLTYNELNEQSNQLAHYLRDQHNIQSDTLIAICVERSLEMAVGLLGILKAGAAYVPLDPNYPQERLRFMLKDSQAPLLVTQSHLRKLLPKATTGIVYLDKKELLQIQPDSNPEYRNGLQDLAYVIYTSGSTGKPKGVMVEHLAGAQHFRQIKDCYQICTKDKVLQFASLNFDTSVEQIFSTWLSGAALVILKSNLITPETLLETLESQQITVADLPPIYWQQLSDNSRTKLLKHLRLLILGGEILPLQLAQKTLEQFPNLTCINAYGPTETVITSTIYPLPSSKLLEKLYSTPIGKPIANRRIYILDANHQPLPINIPGELCIAGECLARGYLNHPELTAEKFIEVEIFGQRQRIYKTGDRARWLPDGNLEFLGRIDGQVKLRGFRIELGEIEATLSQHQAIKDVVVVLHEREENKMLAAYLTLQQQAIESTILRDFLKTRLPDYMIPASFTVLEKLPLTPNGKIDHKALPEPDVSKNKKSIALRTPSEILLATLLAMVLKIDVDSSNAHFFELGGHSLLATKLVLRIRDSFAVDVPLRILFEYPVLSDMAVWLDQQQPGSYLPPIVPQPEDQPRLMSYHQERILFLDQLEGPAATYNTPATLKLTGKLDFPALKQTFILLIERHQSLRLAFDLVNNKPRLREIPVYNPITEIDLSPLPKEQQQTEIEHLVQSHAGKPFVLSRGQLIQLQLLRLSDQENLLLVNMHHIIADGWSLGVLIREWMQIYSSLRQGDIPKLTPLPLQYTDFVAWQRNCVQNNLLQQQQEYWSKQLNGAPTFLRLSTDFPRPEVPSHHGSHLKYYISPELTRQIKEFNKKQGCTLFMTLLAIFNVLLHHYSDQDDILVGCPIANRKNRQTEDIFGLFVNILLFRTQIKEQNTFVDLIKQVRQTAIGAYAHQDLPFELLLQQLNHEQSPSHNPLFQVMFVLQNNEVPELKLPSLEIQTIEQTSSRAKFDLTLYVTEIDDYLELNWNYATDLFQAERIQNMAEHFATLLQSLTQQPKTDIYRLSL